MNRIGMLTVLASLLVAVFCVNCHATDPSAEISILERQAERLAAQIDIAKVQSTAALNQQVVAYKTQIEALLKQRVQIDSQIAQFEAKVEQLHQDSDSQLNRQMKVYTGMMHDVKQQLSSAINKVKAAPTAVSPAAVNPAATNVDPRLKKENASARIRTQ